MIAATKCSSDESKVVKATPKMVSVKDARVEIEEGNCDTWGQLLDIPFKEDKFGLGFTAEAQRAVCKARIGRPPVFITNPRVNAVEDEVEESEFDSWIYPTTDSGPSNWTAKDFTPITFVTQ